jgi:hypothetical protein
MLKQPSVVVQSSAALVGTGALSATVLLIVESGPIVLTASN